MEERRVAILAIFVATLFACTLGEAGIYEEYAQIRDDSDVRFAYAANNVNESAPIVAWLVPHSHCDVGWKRTVDQYYTLNVSIILDQVVKALKENPTRKFNWAETIWIKKWWPSQTEETKQLVRNFIKEGRWEFVSGGWTVNDEAVAHYAAVIEQMTEGHLYLLDEFNARPIVSWQIDPFGASSITPILYAQMGIKYHVISRVDDRLRSNFSKAPFIPGSGMMSEDKAFEFIWKPSQSLGDKLKLFTHCLDTSYISPFSCVNGTCSGFNFEGNPKDNPPITDQNIKQRADLLVSIIKRRSTWYRTPNVLIPFGGDFAYQNSSLEFDNIDKLIDYVNARNATYNVILKYSLASDYFKAVYPQALETPSPSPMQQEKEAASNDSTSVTFPLKDDWGDFFPYATCWGSDLQTFNTCVSYWAGFYTSYPVLKQYTRTRSAILRAANTLFMLSVAHTPFGSSVSWDSLYEGIESLRDAEAILTHHDAITGTAKTPVRADYFNRLMTGGEAALSTAASALAVLISQSGATDNQYPESPPLIGLDMNPLNQTGLNPMQNLFKPKKGDDGHKIVPIIVHNSLAWTRSEVTKIEGLQTPSNNSYWIVFDEKGHRVSSQVVSRSWQPDGGGRAPGFDLYFEASNIPPLGFRTFFLTTATITHNASSTTTTTSGSFRGDERANDPVTLENTAYSITLLWDDAVGYYRMNSVTNKRTSKTYTVSTHLLEYVADRDGAYIFSTLQPASEVTVPNNQATWRVEEGPLVQQFTQHITNNITQTFRLFNSTSTAKTGAQDFLGNFMEVFHSVAVAQNREMVLRFDITPNPSWGADEDGGQFFTDNGVELLNRGRDVIRFEDRLLRDIITGNYYPVQAMTCLRANNFNNTAGELLILTRQSLGVSSQYNHSIELMLHRRTMWDDGRGVEEPLNDTSRLNVPFRVLLDEIGAAEKDRAAQSLAFEYPLQLFYADIAQLSYPITDLGDWTEHYVTSFAPMSADLPRNIHLLSLRPIQTTVGPAQSPQGSLGYFSLVRLQHMYPIDSPYPPFSTNVSIDLHRLLSPSLYSLGSVFKTSLSANQILNYAGPTQANLYPIEMDTWLLYLGKETKSGGNDDDLVVIIVVCAVGALALVLIAAPTIFLVTKYHARIKAWFTGGTEYDTI